MIDVDRRDDAGATRVLIAPDAFKGTFSADAVADAIGRGVRTAGGRDDRCPVADGGEGTMSVLVAALDGRTTSHRVCDPLGRPVTATMGWIDGGATAIVEMAAASGLGLVAVTERDAEAADTRGTGELIVAAVTGGARRILVTVGGSATTDGGSGALAAIAEAGGIRGVELIALSDVTTPFERAAEVYGPQKGADPAAVARLTARLHEQAATFPHDPRGVPMSGGAGGLSGALWAVLGARLESGARYVLDALSFDDRLAEADLVVSGEGRLDRQTFEGKIVGEVASRARRGGIPLHAVVGTCALDADEVGELGLAGVTEAPTLAAIEAAGARLVAP